MSTNIWEKFLPKAEHVSYTAAQSKINQLLTLCDVMLLSDWVPGKETKLILPGIFNHLAVNWLCSFFSQYQPGQEADTWQCLAKRDAVLSLPNSWQVCVICYCRKIESSLLISYLCWISCPDTKPVVSITELEAHRLCSSLLVSCKISEFWISVT